MIKSDALDSLFSLLQEMTLVEHKGAATPIPRWMQLLERYSILGFLVVIALMLLVAAIQYVRPTQILITVGWFLYVVYMLLAMAFFLSVLLNAGQVLWRGRKQRFVWLLTSTQLDMQTDAKYVTKLMTYDKPTLVYGLLQYRHRVDLHDGRVSLLAGDLRKLGFFPTLAASVVAISTLLKNGSNVFLWWPVIVAACFSLMALYSQVQRERPQQVINLLEFAIDQVEAIESAASTEISSHTEDSARPTAPPNQPHQK